MLDTGCTILALTPSGIKHPASPGALISRYTYLNPLFGYQMLKKILFFVFVPSILTYFTYQWIASLPKVEFDASVEISWRSGEEIFWGKGRCSVCHRIGKKGYALRGPNLGESKDGPIMPIRARERASQSGLAGSTEYLVQSIAEPGAFVVPGYNNEMPEVFRAPISLTPSEIKAVILYLESLDGDTTFKEIRLPSELLASYQLEKKSHYEISGDSTAGRDLFFDLEGPAACAACHVGINSARVPAGSTIAPDLTAIAGFRTPEHILQKIINPDSNIVSGYEEVLIRTKSGRLLVGIVTEENKEELQLIERNENLILVNKEDIQSRVPQKLSMMPSNYHDLLTQKQLNDLLAYLVTLQGH
ncbi:c-type cytochrome [candidate division KSB1 bacterium]|nr:c-type cytochrome [candidate division KSB1 bacterium]